MAQFMWNETSVRWTRFFHDKSISLNSGERGRIGWPRWLRTEDQQLPWVHPTFFLCCCVFSADICPVTEARWVLSKEMVPLILGRIRPLGWGRIRILFLCLILNSLFSFVSCSSLSPSPSPRPESYRSICCLNTVWFCVFPKWFPCLNVLSRLSPVSSLSFFKIPLVHLLGILGRVRRSTAPWKSFY